MWTPSMKLATTSCRSQTQIVADAAGSTPQALEAKKIQHLDFNSLKTAAGVLNWLATLRTRFLVP